MKKEGLSLEDIKDSIDKLKNDIAKEEGVMESQIEQLKKEFNVKNIDAAYSMLDKLSAQIDEKSREKARLMKEANESIEKFNL